MFKELSLVVLDGGGHAIALITVDTGDVRPIQADELLHARSIA